MPGCHLVKPDHVDDETGTQHGRKKQLIPRFSTRNRAFRIPIPYRSLLQFDDCNPIPALRPFTWAKDRHVGGAFQIITDDRLQTPGSVAMNDP